MSDQSMQEVTMNSEEEEEEESCVEKEKNKDMYIQVKEVREAFCAIRQGLGCYVCKKVISDPFTITCGHTYCRKCFELLFLLQKDCPRCFFRSVTEREGKPNKEIGKLIQTFRKLEAVFSVDTQIDVSEDLFERSFKVDAEVKKHYKEVIQRNLQRSQSQSLNSIDFEQTVANSSINSLHDLDSEMTTEVFDWNLLSEGQKQKRMKRKSQLSESELPTETLDMQAWKKKETGRIESPKILILSTMEEKETEEMSQDSEYWL